MIRTYDIDRSWRENLDSGPALGDLHPRVPPTSAADLLGFRLASRFGIAAGLLLDSRWILAYSRLGYDILTYKTVRTAEHPSHPPPNWVFVEEARPDGSVRRLRQPPGDPARISSAVCFGMPSMPPDYWRRDVALARQGLQPGQILVVSVVGTPKEPAHPHALAEDYALCARWAAEAGAHLIEANLSCPNVCTAEGSLYHDPGASRLVADAVRSAIGSRPLLLKVGRIAESARLESFLRAVHPLVDGITLVNGVTRPVLEADGTPVFGSAFRNAGVLGRSIHEISVASVRQARQILLRHRWRLGLFAVGGVSTPRDIDDFLQAGADAVLAGSAPMYHPLLACEYKAGSGHAP